MLDEKQTKKNIKPWNEITEINMLSWIIKMTKPQTVLLLLIKTIKKKKKSLNTIKHKY